MRGIKPVFRFLKEKKAPLQWQSFDISTFLPYVESSELDIKGCECKQSEVKSRTQGSRPRTQKNSRRRPWTDFPRTDPFETKDRNARAQGRNYAGILKKKVFSQIFRKISVVLQKEKKSLRKKSQILRKILDEEKQVMTLARF